MHLSAELSGARQRRRRNSKAAALVSALIDLLVESIPQGLMDYYAQRGAEANRVSVIGVL
jgi:hypothetical protein